MDQKYMTAQELAAYTRLAKSTIYLMVERNEIPYIRFGKRVMFESREIESWIEEKKTPAKGS